MDKLTILLIEDDEDVCAKYRNIIDTSDDLILLDVTNSADTAVELIHFHLPTLIILDLELSCGSGTGLEVLATLKGNPPTKKPFILVSTNNISPIVHQTCHDFGADYIITKASSRTPEQTVVETIRLLRPAIEEHLRKSAQAVESPHERQLRITRFISEELNLLNFSKRNIGYRYLTECIHSLITYPSSNPIDTLSEKEHKSKDSIERAMQYSIKKAWATCDIDSLLTHYKGRIDLSKGYPTLTEFIYYYAEKIRLQI